VNRLHPAHRAVLYVTLALLLATGVLWELSGAAEARAWLMKVHGAAAMGVLVAIGALLCVHVPSGWLTRANRASGIAMLGAALWLVVSGYLLYYSGSEAVRGLASASHLWIGIAAPVALALHIARSAAVKRDEKAD